MNAQIQRQIAPSQIYKKRAGTLRSNTLHTANTIGAQALDNPRHMLGEVASMSGLDQDTNFEIRGYQRSGMGGIDSTMEKD